MVLGNLYYVIEELNQRNHTGGLTYGKYIASNGRLIKFSKGSI